MMLTEEQAKTKWCPFARQATGPDGHGPELRGKNLACRCGIGDPCHADVLLELANRPICEEA